MFVLNRINLYCNLGFVDDIIEPRATRRRMCEDLNILASTNCGIDFYRYPLNYYGTNLNSLNDFLYKKI